MSAKQEFFWTSSASDVIRKNDVKASYSTSFVLNLLFFVEKLVLELHKLCA